MGSIGSIPIVMSFFTLNFGRWFWGAYLGCALLSCSPQISTKTIIDIEKIKELEQKRKDNKEAVKILIITTSGFIIILYALDPKDLNK